MSQEASPCISNTEHKLIFDPVPFSGGSKIAVYEMLALCRETNSNVKFTVLTNDKTSWNNSDKSMGISLCRFKLPSFILTQTGGIGYWCKQLVLFFILSCTLLKLRLNNQKISSLIGISGPGVDLALYLCQILLRCEVIQLIQGPVASSRSIGYCLTKADKIFYLRSSKSSITDAMQRYLCGYLDSSAAGDIARYQIASSHCIPFDNGLNQQRWPTPCEYLDTQVFWAASLLKWKGLDTLLAANKLTNSKLGLQYHICYIRPESTRVEVSDAPRKETGVHWYERPTNLDEIRSRCSIFVSTSHNEPFGLSILESLAAGLCVVLPSDKAYWDEQLIDGVNCLKYQPENPQSLADTLQKLAYNPSSIKTIGKAGQAIAQRYKASICYKQIVSTLTGSITSVRTTISRSAA